jgi:membrane associated rhomboid family serine protease
VLIPYNVDVPMERVPFTNWILIGITVLISLLCIFDPSESLIDMLVLQRGDGFAPTQLGGYMLLHAGWLHLLGNMIFLFCFGNAVNAKLGHFPFLILYFALGILSGAAWLALGDGLFLVGASGAIMGIVGAFFVLYPRNDVNVIYFWGVTGTFTMSSWIVILIYIGFDVLSLLKSSGSSVAYIAHVAGVVVGAMAAILLLVTGYIESERYEQNLLQVFHLQK